MSDEQVKGMPDQEVVALAKELFEGAREETRRTLPDSAAKELQSPGITIDLGHRNIHRLPEEVIDIIKVEIERLALSHNSLSALPPKLSECKRLRYLNVRWNAMKEIPPAVLQLSSLEILDVSKNRIRTLPNELSNLTSLKVLAIQKNKIEKLPTCLGDIGSLQVLKLDGNPISFPPSDVCTIKPDTPSPSNENEKDAVITTQVKRWLRQYSTRERLRIESEGDSSESNVETPRPPRRVASGRFPVKPSIGGSDSQPESRAASPTPSVPPPPPIPNRSHFRVQSQQNNGGSRRPAIAPIIINGNERNRSQSEGASSANIRSKRMGMITRKTSELGTVDEVRSKRLSHLRGLSHGTALSGTDAETYQRLASGENIRVGHRPLSDLLEHKRRSRAPDVTIEAAKQLCITLSGMYGMIKNLYTSAMSRPGPVFLMAVIEERNQQFNPALEALSQVKRCVDRFDQLAEEDEDDAKKISKSIRYFAMYVVRAFPQILAAFGQDLPGFIQTCEPRLIRGALMWLHYSNVEVRNCCAMLGAHMAAQPRPPPLQMAQENVVAKPIPNFRPRRYRTGTAADLEPWYPSYRRGPPPVPLLTSEDRSRANTLTSISTATPRSGETFSTLSSASMSRSNTMQSSMGDLGEEEQFEKIFLKLRTACEKVSESIPTCKYFFARSLDNNNMDPNDVLIHSWKRLIQRSDELLGNSYVLNRRLSSIKLRDPVARNQQDFWQQCTALTRSWTELALSVKELAGMGLVGDNIKVLMKPIQRAVKDVSAVIAGSPWSALANGQGTVPGTPAIPPTPTTAGLVPGYSGPGAINTAVSSAYGQPSLGYVTPVPATPLSAALGPAAQATMPSTPGYPPGTASSSSHIPYNSFSSQPLIQPGQSQTGYFAGNVFERADRLLQSQQQRRI